MNFPEYTVSLLIWILPIIAMTVFFIHRRLLSPEKWYSLLVSIALLAAVGVVLDLLFAHRFFTFPEPREVCGIAIRGIPIEEFVFYIAGFWFILFLYVFCDEWFLLKYNVPDERYALYRSRLKRLVFVHLTSIWWASGFFAGAILYKRIFNPAGDLIPGYFIFLLCVAYVPFLLFFRVTRKFVNLRAFVFCLVLTALISIIWEVTLALPFGYWGYQDGAMLGIFISPWHRLPIEAVTVWVFCTLVILVYEFIKICYFTKIPSVPGHKALLSVGREWRNGGKMR
jgi:hypothetical protein